jgi:hypothetical protein
MLRFSMDLRRSQPLLTRYQQSHNTSMPKFRSRCDEYHQAPTPNSVVRSFEPPHVELHIKDCVLRFYLRLPSAPAPVRTMERLRGILTRDNKKLDSAALNCQSTPEVKMVRTSP